MAETVTTFYPSLAAYYHLIFEDWASLAHQARLRSGDLFLASIRDYEAFILTRPSVQEPAFYKGQES